MKKYSLLQGSVPEHCLVEDQDRWSLVLPLQTQGYWSTWQWKQARFKTLTPVLVKIPVFCLWHHVSWYITDNVLSTLMQHTSNTAPSTCNLHHKGLSSNLSMFYKTVHHKNCKIYWLHNWQSLFVLKWHKLIQTNLIYSKYSQLVGSHAASACKQFKHEHIDSTILWNIRNKLPKVKA